MVRKLPERLQTFFRLTGNHTTVRTEILAGMARRIKPLTVILALIFIARYAFMTLD